MQPKFSPDFSLENNFLNMVVAGIDEAGRGPLAGPVVAACVILNKNDFSSEINDSKKLSKKISPLMPLPSSNKKSKRSPSMA